MPQAHVLTKGFEAIGIEQLQCRRLDHARETGSPRIGLSLETKRTAERRDNGEFQDGTSKTTRRSFSSSGS